MTRVVSKRSRSKIGSSGFTLIELLVVIATISVLIDLLLPDVQSVRDAAAAQQTKSSVAERLCDPPYCNALTSVPIQFPAIPGALTANDILGSGITLAYDVVGIPNGDVFAIVDPSSPGPNLFPATFSPAPHLFGGQDYRLAGGRFIGSTLFLDVEEGSNSPAAFTVAVAVSAQHLQIAEADSVPEPGTILPVALAAGVLIYLHRCRLKRHCVCS